MAGRDSEEFDGNRSLEFRSTFPRIDADVGFRTSTWLQPRGEEIHPLHRTIVHALAEAARHEATIGVTLLPEDVGGEEHHYSYRQLYVDARALATQLEIYGVKRGDRVLVVLPTSYEFLVSFFALLRLGAIPCPSYPPAALEKMEAGLERLRHIASHAGTLLCLTNRELRAMLGGLAHAVPAMRDVIDIHDLLAHPAETSKKDRPRAEDSAFIQYTSGSTSHPKGVLLTHGNLIANVHTIGTSLQITRSDVGVSWLPLYHDMGLIGVVLFCIYWRLPLVLMSPTAFLRKPIRWLEAISRFRGTLSPSPNFGYSRCVRNIKSEQREGLDLSSWRAALNGAEPVNLKTLRDFEEAFGPHGFSPSAMLPVYGLAESSLAITIPPQGAPRRHLELDREALASGFVRPVGDASDGDRPTINLVCVGTVLPGHDVRVVDSAGMDVAEGEVGHILIHGPSVMAGYFRDEDATTAVLQDGWLWTGDLGFFGEGGLYVAGRAKDLIIMAGKNYYAEDLEVVAEQVEGVRPGGAAAFGVYDEDKAKDLLVVVCETRAGEDEAAALVEAVCARIVGACRISPDEVVLVPPGTIPKTSSGKRQRALCRQHYLAGELSQRRTSKVDLAQIFVRSQIGHMRMLMRRTVGRRRAPE
jgi:fatty-acyl-CoA synthase